MTVIELMEKLARLPPDSRIMILDGFNGGGEPREVNLGPSARKVTEDNVKYGVDCEHLAGQTVYVIGYGHY